MKKNKKTKTCYIIILFSMFAVLEGAAELGSRFLWPAISGGIASIGEDLAAGNIGEVAKKGLKAFDIGKKIWNVGKGVVKGISHIFGKGKDHQQTQVQRHPTPANIPKEENRGEQPDFKKNSLTIPLRGTERINTFNPGLRQADPNRWVGGVTTAPQQFDYNRGFVNNEAVRGGRLSGQYLPNNPYMNLDRAFGGSFYKVPQAIQQALPTTAAGVFNNLLEYPKTPFSQVRQNTINTVRNALKTASPITHGVPNLPQSASPYNSSFVGQVGPNANIPRTVSGGSLGANPLGMGTTPALAEMVRGGSTGPLAFGGNQTTDGNPLYSGWSDSRLLNM